MSQKRLFIESVMETLWLAGVLIAAMVLTWGSSMLLDACMPHVIETKLSAQSYELWILFGIALGFVLDILLEATRQHPTLGMKAMTAIFYLLVAAGPILLFHEATAYAARMPAGAPTDHLYWLATAYTVGLIDGHILGEVGARMRPAKLE